MADVAYAESSCVYPGSEEPAVDSLDLEIAEGEFVVLVGPSGSGKSTALRMLAGLEPVTSGQILIGGRDVSGVPSRERDIAMVFQNYALYPSKTVRENIDFPLKMRGTDPSERGRKVEEAAEILGLTEFLDRKPKLLSGGQRQRVAMGRAIVREPQVFLMDEPLSNLDAKLRVQTRTQIAELQRRLGVTTVYVTHDQVEAMTMGDRVAVLKDGRLQQAGTPRELYDTPVNAFVAGFIGSPAMNLRDAGLDDGHACLGEARVPLPDDIRAATREAGVDRVTLGVRPEALDVVSDGAGFPVTVSLVEELGADAYLFASIEGEDDEVVARVDGKRHPRAGEQVRLQVRDGAEVHAFHPETGERLGT